MSNRMENRRAETRFKRTYPTLLQAAVTFRGISNRSIIWRYSPMQLWPAWVGLLTIIGRLWRRYRGAAKGFPAAERTTVRRIFISRIARNLAVGSAAIAIGLFVAQEYQRATRFTHNFRTVSPGKIYAGG